MIDTETLVASSHGGRRQAGIAFAALMLVATAVAMAPGFAGQVGRALAEARDRRTPAAVTSPRLALRFSDHPADDEFLRTGLFVQPLVPIGHTTRKENGNLAKALLAYDSERRHGEPDALQPLIGFLAEHPGSAWKSALQVDLGAIYRRTGHFSKALETWQAAWDGSRGFTDAIGRAVSDQAVAYLSQFEAYLGRKEALEPLLNEAKTRPIRGSAAELVSESSRGLAEMLTRPDAAFKCGPSALARILATEAPSPSSPQSLKVLQRSQSTPNGLILDRRARHLRRSGDELPDGLSFRRRTRFSSRPSPTGRSATTRPCSERMRADITASATPTFGEDITVSQSTLDEEASGYFLVGPGKLPTGWRSVDATEGNAVWGRGDTGLQPRQRGHRRRRAACLSVRWRRRLYDLERRGHGGGAVAPRRSGRIYAAGGAAGPLPDGLLPSRHAAADALYLHQLREQVDHRVAQLRHRARPVRRLLRFRSPRDRHPRRHAHQPKSQSGLGLRNGLPARRRQRALCVSDDSERYRQAAPRSANNRHSGSSARRFSRSSRTPRASRRRASGAPSRMDPWKSSSSPWASSSS